MYKFKKGEKALVWNQTKLKGRVGTVVYQIGNRIKLSIEGEEGTKTYTFSPDMLRKVMYKTKPIVPDLKDCVKIVDAKGNPRLREFIGKSGVVHYSGEDIISVRFYTTKNAVRYKTRYFSPGDVLPLKDKEAWVLHIKQDVMYGYAENKYVTRKKLKFSHLRQDKAMWRDENHHMISDDLVYDSLDVALTKFRKYTRKKKIKVVE